MNSPTIGIDAELKKVFYLVLGEVEGERAFLQCEVACPPCVTDGAYCLPLELKDLEDRFQALGM